MAEHVGLVLNMFEDRTAEVIVDRKAFCNGCDDTGRCRACLAGARRVETVQNPIGARRGDVVFVYLEGSSLWTEALLVYIIPVMWLMAGALVGSGLGQGWKIGETGGAILLGLAGLAIGFMIIFVISESLKHVHKIAPRIVSVIDSNPEHVGAAKGGDRRTNIISI